MSWNKRDFLLRITFIALTLILACWAIYKGLESVKVVKLTDTFAYNQCLAEQAQGWHARNGKLLRWQAEAICREQTRVR